jgi:hypothetical protein
MFNPDPALPEPKVIIMIKGHYSIISESSILMTCKSRISDGKVKSSLCKARES